MKKISKCLIILFVLLLVSIPPVFLLIFLPKPQPKAKEINVSLQYEDHYTHPNDYPVVGIDYIIYDGLNAIIGVGTTDALGMMTFVILEGYNQSGKGIHIEYKNSFRIFIKIMWQGTLISIDNLAIGELREVEVPFFNFQFTFLWDDMTPIANEQIEIWINGILVDTKTTSSTGDIVLQGVIDGVYTFVSVSGVFDDFTYTVLVDTPTISIIETIVISAQFVRISRIMCGNKLGSFIFYAHYFIPRRSKLDFCLLVGVFTHLLFRPL